MVTGAEHTPAPAAPVVGEIALGLRSPEMARGLGRGPIVIPAIARNTNSEEARDRSNPILGTRGCHRPHTGRKRFALRRKRSRDKIFLGRPPTQRTCLRIPSEPPAHRQGPSPPRGPCARAPGELPAHQQSPRPPVTPRRIWGRSRSIFLQRKKHIIHKNQGKSLAFGQKWRLSRKSIGAGHANASRFVRPQRMPGTPQHAHPTCYFVQSAMERYFFGLRVPQHCL